MKHHRRFQIVLMGEVPREKKERLSKEGFQNLIFGLGSIIFEGQESEYNGFIDSIGYDDNWYKMIGTNEWVLVDGEWVELTEENQNKYKDDN